MEEHVKILNKGNTTNNFLSSQSDFSDIKAACKLLGICNNSWNIFFFLRNVLENELAATIKNEIRLSKHAGDE